MLAAGVSDRADLELRYVGSAFDDDRNERRLGDFVVLGLGLSRELWPGWTAFARAENLLDRDVEVSRSADGLITLGTPFSAHAGIRIAL